MVKLVFPSFAARCRFAVSDQPQLMTRCETGLRRRHTSKRIRQYSCTTDAILEEGKLLQASRLEQSMQLNNDNRETGAAQPRVRHPLAVYKEAHAISYLCSHGCMGQRRRSLRFRIQFDLASGFARHLASPRSVDSRT